MTKLAILYAETKEECFYLNILNEDNSKRRFKLEVTSKCMASYGSAYADIISSQVKLLNTIISLNSVSGLQCRIEYSQTACSLIGSICTLAFECEELAFTGSMKLRIVCVEDISESEICFPYKCI